MLAKANNKNICFAYKSSLAFLIKKDFRGSQLDYLPAGYDQALSLGGQEDTVKSRCPVFSQANPV